MSQQNVLNYGLDIILNSVQKFHLSYVSNVISGIV